jgi:hypothetical protein
MEPYKHIPLHFPRLPADRQLRASREFLSRMAERRSVRFFFAETRASGADRKRDSLRIAGSQRRQSTAVEVRSVKDPAIKRRIREAAEAEERESYEHRMPSEWLQA